MKKVIPIIFWGASVILTQCGPGTNTETKYAKSSPPVQASELAVPSVDDTLKREVQETSKILQNLYEREDAKIPSTSEDQPPYVKFADIKKWQAVGEEHAAGYDANDKLLAIYDLTYQNVYSIEFFGRTVLGTIGAGDMNLRELIRLIRNAVRERRNYTGLAGPLSDEDYNKVGKVLSKIEAKYGDVQSPLRGDWWKQIPIKTGSLANAAESFKLSDIDIEKDMNEIQKFQYRQNLQTLLKSISDIFQIDASNLFELLMFKRNPSGNYDLVMNNAASLFPNEQPEKVVDFMRYKQSFGYALLYLAIKTAITSIGGAIPQPAVAAIVKYATSRWFELFEEQRSFHRFRAYEFVNAAERDAPSPLSFLSYEQRERAGVYILSHESSIFHTIFDVRDEAFFHKSVKIELGNVSKNTEWTKRKKLTLQPLSQLYYNGDDSRTEGMDYILAMAGRPRFQQMPFVAVDYKNPELELFRRNLVKITYDLMHAVNGPFPGVDMLMILLFDVFIMDDVRDALRWEARLVSWMKEHPDTDYSTEIERIYAQRVNPFEFDLEEENGFVVRSKAYLGL